MTITLDNETLRTAVWAIVALFTIQGATIYAIVQLTVTGKRVFERRPLNDVDRERLASFRRD